MRRRSRWGRPFRPNPERVWTLGRGQAVHASLRSGRRRHAQSPGALRDDRGPSRRDAVSSPTLSSCLGGIGIPPAVTLSGSYRGDKVQGDVRLCDWPGGVAGAAYWAAVDSPRDLKTVSAHLHCDDDPVRQQVPIRWASVRACVRGFLRPSHRSGPSVRIARQAITRALRVAAFAPYAGIFPRVPGRQECVVRAGPPSNIFRGVCSASVKTGGAGAHTVTFSQDFGRSGTYTWTIRVPAHRPARLVKASGRGLVQLIR